MVRFFLIKTKLDRTQSLQNKVWNQRRENGVFLRHALSKSHFKRFTIPDQ
jgi:hypothetical protein